MKGFFLGLVEVTILLVIALSSVTGAYAAGPKSLEVQDVNVTNFPQTQNVKGSVAVEGVVSHARSAKAEGMLVPTSTRDNLNELVFAGSVDTDGFTAVTISLQGEIKSNNFFGGRIGVLLIPDEAPVLRVLRDRRLVQFPIECIATVKTGDSEYFSAPQCQGRVSFPRYRMYFYNTVNATVEANSYLYLSN